MDFLDPKKQKAHRMRLRIGYVLVATALLLATTILLYQAYGYRINREGQIIQNGLVFVSSNPTGAAIFANGQRLDKNTNQRLSLVAGQYTLELKREGYHTWKRGITVEGGSVQRFLHPLLIPMDLRTSSVKKYDQAPSLTTQSPDRRWLLIHTGADSFDLFDLEQSTPAPQPRTITPEITRAGTKTTGYSAVQWASDNRRVVLKRLYTKDGAAGAEYILYDRERPNESRNLTTLLGFNPTELHLRDNKFDSYYAFDKKSGVVFTATLKQPTPQPLIRGALAFEPDGASSVLFATNTGAPKDKTLIRLLDDATTYTLREAPRDTNFVLEIGTFEGKQVIGAGSVKEGRTFVYRDPLESLREDRLPAPSHILKLANPKTISLSLNGRFIATQRADNFAVYDAETNRGYAFTVDLPKATKPDVTSWMDGHRLLLNANQTLYMFDYDGTNQHKLGMLKRSLWPAVTPNQRKVYSVQPNGSFVVTNLRTEQDE